VDEARRLLAEAGYPGGRDARTGEPLVVNLDTTGSGMGDKSTVDWLNKQFRKLDVQLVVRATDYNRFQDKIRKGNAQLFYWGWNADYPDPENFLFLLYGAQGKVKSQGENAANYENAEYDRLFERMKAMPDSPERQAIIERMLAILQHDAPWVWGFYEKAYTLQHGWLLNRKPGKIIRNTLKYQRIDVAARQRLRAEWNRPVVWPLSLVALLGALVVAPAVIHYRRGSGPGLAAERGAAPGAVAWYPIAQRDGSRPSDFSFPPTRVMSSSTTWADDLGLRVSLTAVHTGLPSGRRYSRVSTTTVVLSTV
jgi:oligopeptide transport system substrate-binding protein